MLSRFQNWLNINTIRRTFFHQWLSFIRWSLTNLEYRMIKTLMFILFTIGFIYSVIGSYLLWFNSSYYFKLKSNEQQNRRKLLRYLPHKLTYNFFDHHKKVDLWYSRIMFLIAMILCMFGMIIAIWHGGIIVY